MPPRLTDILRGQRVTVQLLPISRINTIANNLTAFYKLYCHRLAPGGRVRLLAYPLQGLGNLYKHHQYRQLEL